MGNVFDSDIVFKHHSFSCCYRPHQLTSDSRFHAILHTHNTKFIEIRIKWCLLYRSASAPWSVTSPWWWRRGDPRSESRCACSQQSYYPHHYHYHTPAQHSRPSQWDLQTICRCDICVCFRGQYGKLETVIQLCFTKLYGS